MAITSGVAMTTLSIDNSAGVAKDVRNDISNWAISTPRAVQDITGLAMSANARLLLLADFSFDGSGFFNPATDRLHDVMKTVPSTSVNRTTTITFGGVTIAPELLFTDYNLTRDAGAAITTKFPGVNADGAVPTWA
jgi:hypothetical protein